MKNRYAKWFALFMVMMTGVNTAWSQTLSLEDFYIEMGTTQLVTIDLVQGEYPVLGFQADVILPEGMTIQRVRAVDGILPNDEWGEAITPSLSFANGHLLMYNDKGLTINDDATSLVQLYVLATSDFKGGEIILENIIISGMDNVKITPDDVIAQVTTNYVPPLTNDPALALSEFFIESGKTTQVTIDLVKGRIPVLGFQADIMLPDGLTVQRVKAVDGILPDDEWGNPIVPSVSYTNGHLLMYNDKGVTINDDATALVTLYVTAASDFPGGEMVLDNIIISGEGNVKITSEPLFVEVTSDYVEPVTDLYYDRGHSTLEVSEDYDYETIVLGHTQDYGFSEYGALTINGNAVLTTGFFSFYADPYMEWAERGSLANHSAALVNNVEMYAEDINAELWIPDGKWIFLSFPYDVRVSDIFPQRVRTEWVIRKYDGQQRAEGNMDDTWVNMKANDVLNAYEGYIWQSARKWGRTGFIVPALDTENMENIFAIDPVEVPLIGYDSEFAHNRSWNLVGNPYPCYYHIGAMEFAAPITTWDVNSQSYQAYRPGDDNYVLCPFEAFFVQRPDTEESIVFHPEGRQTDRYVADYNVKGIARARAITARRDVLNLTLSDGIYTDRTRVVVNESASSGYELDKDASKFLSSNSQAPQFFSVDGELRYAINERPFNDGVITLGTTIVNSGRYTIALQTTSDMVVTLEDKETGALVQLNGTEGYSFTAQAGTLKSRFVIHLTNPNPTGIDHVKQTPAITDTEIFTLDGRRVQKMNTSGIYIVKQGERVVKQYVK